eukprot:TRINITY_DN7646_c0_g4_i1.p1 TRINITY_DN7646_c0_g4~~TRINITY_DN7646_c0_g4_i1.p1  ORF type:complete len:267 (-),score=98.88 TRINITY_DN7646_c0_g4_i1:110-910(-)
MTDELEQQLEELERMHDEMESQQSNQSGQVQGFLADAALLTPRQDDSSGSPSPSLSPGGVSEHQRRQIRDLTRALATERRARREQSRQLTEVEAMLLAAEEEKQDATERAQQLEDDYLAAQQALSKTDSEHHEIRRTSRALAEKLRQSTQQQQQHRAEGLEELDGLDMAQLCALEERWNARLVRVRGAKAELQRRQVEDLQREREALIEKKLCAVCMAEEADATFVHGDSGHQACCHECALAVKTSTGKCPICNQQIEAVIRHFNA